MLLRSAPALCPALSGPVCSLPGARPLTFRRLRAAERGRLTEHLLRLPREDRRMRFCGCLSEESVRRYAAGLDWSRTVVLAAFAEGEMCGAAELLRPDPPVTAAAELALSVAGPFQDRGIGTELVRRSRVLARNRFIGSVHMTFVHGNAKMRHIARKFGAELRVREGEVHARLTPGWLSMLDEAAFEAEARLGTVISAGPT